MGPYNVTVFLELYLLFFLIPYNISLFFYFPPLFLLIPYSLTVIQLPRLFNVSHIISLFPLQNRTM